MTPEQTDLVRRLRFADEFLYEQAADEIEWLAGGWQPIETARKCGVVDLWSEKGSRYPDAIWDVVEYALDAHGDDTYGWTDKNHHGSIEGAGPFTHWRYPPAPPEVTP